MHLQNARTIIHGDLTLGDNVSLSVSVGPNSTGLISVVGCLDFQGNINLIVNRSFISTPQTVTIAEFNCVNQARTGTISAVDENGNSVCVTSDLKQSRLSAVLDLTSCVDVVAGSSRLTLRLTTFVVAVMGLVIRHLTI